MKYFPHMHSLSHTNMQTIIFLTRQIRHNNALNNWKNISVKKLKNKLLCNNSNIWSKSCCMYCNLEITKYRVMNFLLILNKS